MNCANKRVPGLRLDERAAGEDDEGYAGLKRGCGMRGSAVAVLHG